MVVVVKIELISVLENYHEIFIENIGISDLSFDNDF